MVRDWCMGREKITTHKGLGFCQIDLDFARAQYFTNFKGTAGGRGRVVIGYDLGSWVVVIDGVFTSIFCLC